MKLYPNIAKYKTAIQNPGFSFKGLDPILSKGSSSKLPTKLGIWLDSGSFACVFKFETLSPNKTWAIRCFTKEVQNLHLHYHNLSLRISGLPCSKYFLAFEFLGNGIRIDQSIYPILKMEWTDGNTLLKFIESNYSNSIKLKQLSSLWIDFSQDCYESRISHGDLQHGNIIIVDNNGLLRLQLVDYDTFYFEEDGKNITDDIRGLPEYQHPLRSDKTPRKRCLQVDFFSQLVILISIEALIEKSSLFEVYIKGKENLLFTLEDFENPNNSQIFKELLNMSPNINRMTKELIRICKLSSIEDIPSLNDVLARNKSIPTQAPVPWRPRQPNPNPFVARTSNPVQSKQIFSAPSQRAKSVQPPNYDSTTPSSSGVNGKSITRPFTRNSSKTKKKWMGTLGIILIATMVLGVSHLFYSNQPNKAGVETKK